MAENTPTVADPGPLGLAAFATTTFVLSLVNAGLINAGDIVVVLPIALMYGGVAQLLAGMWEFKRNNTFGAVAFTSYGAFWLSFYFLATKFLKGAPTDAVAVFLLAWTIFTLYMVIGSFGTNGVLAALFVILEVTFILLTWGAFANSSGITKIGGYLGIIVAFIAWYASAAAVVNPTLGKTVFPTFPFSK
ncbi:MAG: acetate uptake transporter [Actinomycetota bacterium]|nr:acetate uptake transporter [Actinomycetota bacterium]